MGNINFKKEGNRLTVALIGHIDSANAGDVEKEIREILDAEKPSDLVLDADQLNYISSAGLRIILRLRKEYADLKIINVSSDV